jgi:type I restriction enzyme S subunit
MAKIQPYPEYSDSDVAWLGMSPSHWTVTRIKFGSNLNPPKSEVRALQGETEVSFLPMESIGDDGCLDLSKTKSLAEVLDGYSYVANGDVMIAKITPCFENGKGAVAEGLCNGLGFATTEVIVLRPHRQQDSRFIYYLLSSEPFRSIAEGSMYGAGGQKRVADNFVANFYVAWPTPSERKSVANFLDHETAKIDRLIAKQERLIELLKEKRQAVISHAVTKGLNPDAPMKDSGVEWLGEVPAHWDVSKIKFHISLLEQGWSPQCENRLAEEGEYGVLKVGCVNGIDFNADEHKALPKELSPRVEYVLRKGDLLISRANTKELVGSAIVVDKSYSHLLLCDKLYRIRLDERCSPDFLALFLGIRVARDQIELGASGASHSMQNIGQDTIKDMAIPLPNIEEQIGILDWVQDKLLRFSQLESKARKSIELMQEHRTALISAAVTGKIDLRGWQKPNTQPEETAAAVSA